MKTQFTIIFLVLFMPCFVGAQITKPGYKKPVQKKTTPALAGPKMFTGNSQLVITFDAPGTLYVDFIKIFDFKQGDVWRSPIMAGKHHVKYTNGIETWEKAIECKAGQQEIISTELYKLAAPRLNAEKNQQQFNKFKSDGARAMQNGNMVSALESYLKAREYKLNDDYVNAKILELEDRLNTKQFEKYKNEAEAYLTNNEKENALSSFKKAKEYNATDTYINNKIKQLTDAINDETFRSYKTKGDNYFNNGAYGKAIVEYQNALAVKDDSGIKERIAGCEVKLGVIIDPRDKQLYKIVELNGLIWMAENLNYNIDGSNCYDDNPDNCETYGRLYTYQEATQACPPGWRLPTKDEYMELRKTYRNRGLKNNGTSGFNALLGGYFYSGNVGYYNQGKIGIFWISSESAAEPWALRFSSGRCKIHLVLRSWDEFSCRCLKDD